MERGIDSEVAASASTLPAIGTSALSPYTFRQRLRSGYHVFWYRLGEALCWSRGIYRERPAIRLAALTGRQQERILFLKRRYAVRFERYGAQETTLKSYDYLDILDQAWTAWGQSRPSGVAVHDVGSSNFWYARVLQSFFRPSALTGVEVEGYRIYANGYSRWDYAQDYVQGLPQTSFVVSNYAQYDQKADVVSVCHARTRLGLAASPRTIGAPYPVRSNRVQSDCYRIVRHGEPRAGRSRRRSESLPRSGIGSALVLRSARPPSPAAPAACRVLVESDQPELAASPSVLRQVPAMSSSLDFTD